MPSLSTWRRYDARPVTLGLRGGSVLVALCVCLNFVLAFTTVQRARERDDETMPRGMPGGPVVSARRALEGLGVVEGDIGLTTVGVGFLLAVLGSMSSATGLTLIRASNVLDNPRLARYKRWRFVWGIVLANGLTSILDTLSLSLAPLSVLAPLGALTVVLSLAVAHTGVAGIREPLTMRQVAPSSLIVFGIAVCTIVGAKPEVDLTMQHLNSSIGKPGFVAFFVTSIVSIFGWVVLLNGGRCIRHQLSRRWDRLTASGTAVVGTMCSAITAGLSAANTKTMMKIVSTWARAHTSGIHVGVSYLGLGMAAMALPIFAFLQLYLMNSALTTGRVILAVPVYMASMITSTIISGACVFDDMRDLHDQWRISTLAISLVGVVVGIFTLAQQSSSSDDGDGDRANNGHQQRIGPALELVVARADSEYPARRRAASEPLSNGAPAAGYFADADAHPSNGAPDARDLAPSDASPQIGEDAEAAVSSTSKVGSMLSPPLLDSAAEDDVATGEGYGWCLSWRELWAQGAGEVILARYYALEGLLIVCAILSAFILRRLAYLRHVPLAGYIHNAVGANVSDSTMLAQPDRFRLRDIGFEMIPDHSSDEHFAIGADFLSAFSFWVATMPLGLGTLMRRRPPTRPVFVLNILIRWFRMLTVIEVLRPIFYLWTSLPAPDINCVIQNETLRKPVSFGSIFVFGGAMPQGCGDLVLSGHLSASLVAFFICMHYSELVWGEHVRVVLYVYYFTIGLLVAAMCYIIVAIRYHYTIDIVVAIITTLLLWNWLQSRLGKRDVHPVQVIVEGRVCSLRCCIPRASMRTRAGLDDEMSASSAHPRHLQAELDRVAAVAPWKGYLGAFILTLSLSFGMWFFLSAVFNAMGRALAAIY